MLGLKTTPVGVAVTEPTDAVMLFAGVVPPRSTESSTPIGADPPTSCTAVTTANPRLLVPHHGAMGLELFRGGLEIDGTVGDHVEKHGHLGAGIQIDAFEIPAGIDGRIDQFFEVDRFESRLGAGLPG